MTAVSADETVASKAEPLQLATDYIHRISKGDIPPKITTELDESQAVLKQYLNELIDLVHMRNADIRWLVESAVSGNFDARADPKKYAGQNGRMLASINQLIDALTEPIRLAARAIHGIAIGEIPNRLDGSYRGEFATLINNLNECIGNVHALVDDAGLIARSSAAGDLTMRADVSRHRGAYRQIVDGFNQTLDLVVEPLRQTARTATELNASARTLNNVSQQLAGNAEETATQARVVSRAGAEVSESVTAVASSAMEMQASIREIAARTHQSAAISTKAVSRAEAANQTVSKLGDSSAEIGKVVKVITSIAQQTNLLALNATIEAARAGEAGKGFAVVANEVKELAKATAKATEEIGQKIAAIQDDTKRAVQAIAEISSIIHETNETANVIASSVEAQTLTTNEIGARVNRAAEGTNAIASNISGVASAAQETTRAAQETQQAARALNDMSQQLNRVVSAFRV